MTKLSLGFIISFFYTVCLCGQVYSKGYIKPAIGFNIPIVSLKNGALTDDLIKYDDSSIRFQLLSGCYFFHQHWGVELTIAGRFSARLNNRLQRFEANLVQLYRSNYFVDVITPDLSFETEKWGSFIDQVLIGLVHRLEKKRWLLLSGISIGTLTFDTNVGQVYLKERGSNTIHQLSFSTGEPPHFDEYLIVVPSISIGYRISEYLFIQLDARYTFFDANLAYTETRRDTYTEATTTKKIAYDKRVHQLGIGFGLIFNLFPAQR